MRLLGYTIVGVLVVSIILFSARAFRKSQEFNIRSDNSIVRLHTLEGQFFCSGVVITPNAIATAAHCVVVETPFGSFVDPNIQVEVRGQDGQPTGVIAHFGNIDGRLDTAMLLGDFSHFNTRTVEENPAQIDAILMNPDSKIVACGYPLGGPLICSKVSKVLHYVFWYKALGWLYPGMSGGPVIDVSTGRVIAINRAVDESGIILAPLVDFFYDMLPQS